jgi:hypothetical protein
VVDNVTIVVDIVSYNNVTVVEVNVDDNAEKVKNDDVFVFIISFVRFLFVRVAMLGLLLSSLCVVEL